MIKIEREEVLGLDHAIRGMRNPKNSWNKSDSQYSFDFDEYKVGENDFDLMMRLAKAGPVHAKYRRMIVVYMDITAPLYWWKEFDTYKVGTVANSCSTMHKIMDKQFEISDFSHDQMKFRTIELLDQIVAELNFLRDNYIAWDTLSQEIKDYYHWYEQKDIWWQIIQLLPSSYNQKRTVMLNYEVLHNMHESRRNHKLDEWQKFCDKIESLPYADIILAGE